MRQLSEQLVRNLPPPASGDGSIIASIRAALTEVRGRPVRLRKVAFPHGIASGLWVDRASHDLIAYEENTEPEHQIVIIGHEAWHMFQGHCSSATPHGSAASRADQNPTADALAELVAVISAADDADLPLASRTDALLHFSARAEAREIHQEREAELFGVRFATDVQAAVADAYAATDPHNLASRIKGSMAHRVRRF